MAVPRTDFSQIPAGYTYLAQFVDHDISLDSQSRKAPWERINPLNSFNERVPVFDLEQLYGADAAESSKYLEIDSAYLKLGKTSVPQGSTSKQSFLLDLPRRRDKKADIYDSRNDENLLIAQTQVAFATFHNTIVAKLQNNDLTDVKELYKQAREQTIRHYQNIILKDFLPRILNDSLENILTNGHIFYKLSPTDKIYIPLEYSVAAFRTGHSMVRNFYQLNLAKRQTLSDVTEFTGNGELGNQKSLPSDWLINWNLFYDLPQTEAEKTKFNNALKFSTKISSALGDMRGKGLSSFSRDSSLAAFDLFRGHLFGLPTGQELADEIGLTPLDSLLIEQCLVELNATSLVNAFKTETPLWFYLLAEAQKTQNGEKLGEMGSRIIAEVFVELIKRSPSSILDQGEPLKYNFPSATEPFYGTNGQFGMKEMLSFIASNPRIIEGETVNENFLNPSGS